MATEGDFGLRTKSAQEMVNAADPGGRIEVHNRQDLVGIIEEAGLKPDEILVKLLRQAPETMRGRIIREIRAVFIDEDRVLDNVTPEMIQELVESGLAEVTGVQDDVVGEDTSEYTKQWLDSVTAKELRAIRTLVCEADSGDTDVVLATAADKTGLTSEEMVKMQLERAQDVAKFFKDKPSRKSAEDYARGREDARLKDYAKIRETQTSAQKFFGSGGIATGFLTNLGQSRFSTEVRKFLVVGFSALFGFGGTSSVERQDAKQKNGDRGHRMERVGVSMEDSIKEARREAGIPDTLYSYLDREDERESEYIEKSVAYRVDREQRPVAEVHHFSIDLAKAEQHKGRWSVAESTNKMMEMFFDSGLDETISESLYAAEKAGLHAPTITIRACGGFSGEVYPTRNESRVERALRKNTPLAPERALRGAGAMKKGLEEILDKRFPGVPVVIEYIDEEPMPFEYDNRTYDQYEIRNKAKEILGIGSGDDSDYALDVILNKADTDKSFIESLPQDQQNIVRSIMKNRRIDVDVTVVGIREFEVKVPDESENRRRILKDGPTRRGRRGIEQGDPAQSSPTPDDTEPNWIVRNDIWKVPARLEQFFADQYPDDPPGEIRKRRATIGTNESRRVVVNAVFVEQSTRVIDEQIRRTILLKKSSTRIKETVMEKSPETQGMDGRGKQTYGSGIERRLKEKPRQDIDRRRHGDARKKFRDTGKDSDEFVGVKDAGRKIRNKPETGRSSTAKAKSRDLKRSRKSIEEAKSVGLSEAGSAFDFDGFRPFAEHEVPMPGYVGATTQEAEDLARLEREHSAEAEFAWLEKKYDQEIQDSHGGADAWERHKKEMIKKRPWIKDIKSYIQNELVNGTFNQRGVYGRKYLKDVVYEKGREAGICVTIQNTDQYRHEKKPVPNNKYPNTKYAYDVDHYEMEIADPNGKKHYIPMGDTRVESQYALAMAQQLLREGAVISADDLATRIRDFSESFVKYPQSEADKIRIAENGFKLINEMLVDGTSVTADEAHTGETRDRLAA